MLQDVQHGKRTEITEINGEFCRLGGLHGVASPLNDALTSMVESIRPRPRGEKG